jgi:DnaJ-class molecular chaperone
MNKNINYYAILEVSHKFEKSELKSNYRTLSKKHHPDKNGDPEYFKLLAESYKVLTSVELKDQYDKESKFGSNYDSFLEILNFEFNNTNETSTKIYDKMDKYKKDEMLHIVLELSEFTDTISYDRNVVCSKCDGSTNISASNLNLKGKMGDLFADEEITCDICDGTGTFKTRECPGCHGNGYMKLGFSKCDKCSGNGIIEVNKTINIKEIDFKNGKLKIPFYGNQSKYSGSTGNLYIIITSLLDSDQD